jgi:DNA-binding transcriptional LysR family regulator
MDSTIGWELYRSLLAVLREGSLSGAARLLGITQPTVGRHIEALESALGLALFTRAPTGLVPLEVALALRPYAEAMASTARALERAAGSHGEGVSGTVRISASEVVGVELLPPVLAALSQALPALKVELVLSNRVQDLLRREADIAVRMTAPRQDALVARRLGEIELGLHAHRAYLERRGLPTSPAQLAGHTLIGFDEETPFIRAQRAHLPAGLQRRDFSLRADSDLAQLALIRAGAGIGVCQAALAARDQQLVRVLPQAFALRLPVWLAMHEDVRDSPRCRVSYDALAAGLVSWLSSA